MTTHRTADTPSRSPALGHLPNWGPGRTCVAILRRDLFVTGREFPVFLAQVILQPLFLLFVFGKVLTELGYARPGYVEVLFPGLVALAAVLTGLQSTALPLVIEFSYSNEIEDRLLAPLPIGAVAVEKVVFAAMRACVAAAVMFPVGVWILGSIPWRASTGPAVVAMIVLGALLGAAMGLILGTYVPPNRISVTLDPGPDPPHLHRVQPVPVALARPYPVVPGGVGPQPDDLRERRPARPHGAGRTPYPDLDLLCGGRRLPGRPHGRRNGRLQATGPRVTGRSSRYAAPVPSEDNDRGR